MIEAIILDMDGVISHTSRVHALAETKLLARLGINLPPEEIIMKYSGFKETDTFRDILRGAGVEGDPEKLKEDKWKIIYSDLSRRDITPILGVKQFIASLKSENYPLAIASSAPLKFINFVIDALELDKQFSVLTSGDEVEKGKPDPAIFLLTAQKLGIQPEACLVIEDAPNGIRAARAAGMKSLGITTTHSRKELEAADRIINSFEEFRLEEIKSL